MFFLNNFGGCSTVFEPKLDVVLFGNENLAYCMLGTMHAFGTELIFKCNCLLFFFWKFSNANKIIKFDKKMDIVPFGTELFKYVSGTQHLNLKAQL